MVLLQKTRLCCYIYKNSNSSKNEEIYLKKNFQKMTVDDTKSLYVHVVKRKQLGNKGVMTQKIKSIYTVSIP